MPIRHDTIYLATRQDNIRHEISLLIYTTDVISHAEFDTDRCMACMELEEPKTSKICRICRFLLPRRDNS